MKKPNSEQRANSTDASYAPPFHLRFLETDEEPDESAGVEYIAFETASNVAKGLAETYGRAITINNCWSNTVDCIEPEGL